MSKAEAIQRIDDFLNDQGGDWDWDDFITIRDADPDIRRIQDFARRLPDLYPPRTVDEYCNSEGMQALRELLDKLRSE